ncbi:hypothetical protein Tco_0407471 [Tanacetum coccineum]
MSTSKFAETHNLIAFLEKPEESSGFEDIIDFLNANQIRYALIFNPTIYTSCIEQFWVTAKVKTFNGERQLQALVDKKKVIITETSIRSDLKLEELARMGYEKPSQRLTFYKAFFSPQWKFLIHTITQCLSAKTTAWNEFSSTMASAIICLATNQKFNLSKYIFDAMTPITTQPLSSRPQKKQSRRKQRKETEVPQDETHHDDSVHIPSNDPLLSGEDRMQLTELMILCTNLQKQVLDLEKAKDAQAKEIAGESRRVESSEDKDSLGSQEDASKQGRSFEDINKDAGVSLVDETQGRSDDAEMFDTDDLHGDEVIVDMAVGEKQEQSAKVDEREVSTGVEDSVAPTIPVTTAGEGVTTTKIDEITTTSVTTSTKNKNNDKTQDFKLAQRLQTEEQREITIEERSRLFVKLMKKRKKHFAMLRAEEKRRKPPTKAKKRNLMSTYLKNMGGYKHNQLKSKSYEEIQNLFDNKMRRVNTFIPIDSKVVKSKKETEESSKGIEDELESDKSKKAESSEEEKAKGSRKKILGKKIAGKEQQQESSKRQRMEDDKETDEHEEVEVDDEAELKKHLKEYCNSISIDKSRWKVPREYSSKIRASGCSILDIITQA